MIGYALLIAVGVLGYLFMLTFYTSYSINKYESVRSPRVNWKGVMHYLYVIFITAVLYSAVITGVQGIYHCFPV